MRSAERDRERSGGEVRPDVEPNGGYGLAGKANLVARLDRIQKTLQLQTATDLSDQFRGLVRGPVEVSAPTFDAVSAVVDLAVEKFEFGPPTKPTWAEPWVKLKGGVGYQFGTDTLTLKDTVVERDGLTVSGSGTVAKVSTEMVLDVSGTLGYDLAKVEPVLTGVPRKTAAEREGHPTVHRPRRVARRPPCGGTSR